ncbi:MAG: DNA-processing protein DprA [Clostridia bacterium]|nr:DNA-processing protein DprA [Clostridia bacterium]
MDTVYWIWLALACGAGSEGGSLLLEKYETPRKIYELTPDEIADIDGIDEGLKSALCDKDTSYPERIYEYCQRVNVGIMTLDSPIYPERLKRIHAKPLVLYYKGRIPNIDDNVLVACVGTRSCTEYGLKTAYKLGAELAEAGAIVVSGMALGIDGACQRGALAAGGMTIAVLGCGIDVIYPPKHEELYRAIAENGAIITEFAPRTSPDGANFPIRNRIISGLSLGTCVVEADRKSGALITARHAEKQGRDVFAFPGRAGSKESDGTNALIHDGATMVRGARDILEEYELMYPHRIFTENISRSKYFTPKDDVKLERVSEQEAEKTARRDEEEIEKPKLRAKKEKAKAAKEDPEPKKEHDTSSFSEIELAVYEAMNKFSSLDEIRAEASRKMDKELAAGEVLATLTGLEILGVCRALPGGIYSLN